MTREEWENEMVEITNQQHVLRREIDEIRDPRLQGSTYAEQKVSGSAGETIEYHTRKDSLNRGRTIWCARKDHPDYAKMSFEKKPQAGEWWELESVGRVYVVGLDTDGDPVFIVNAGDDVDMYYMSMFIPIAKHLPNCTGWDWEPPAPVTTESPDDWVVQDRVPARAGIDRGWWVYDAVDLPHNKSHCWRVRDTSKAKGMQHGQKGADGIPLNVFCQRKDLPPIQQAAEPELEYETLAFHECVAWDDCDTNKRLVRILNIESYRNVWDNVIPTGNIEYRKIPKGSV